MAFAPTDDWVLTWEVLWKRWSNWKNFFIVHPNPRFEDTWNVRFGGEKEFDLVPGGTSEDRKFTYCPVNCVGACALAPVMVVDGEYFGGVTVDSAVELLHNIAEGKVVAKGSGVPDQDPTKKAAPKKKKKKKAAKKEKQQGGDK